MDAHAGATRGTTALAVPNDPAAAVEGAASRVLPTVAAGVVIGVTEALIAVSFAALVFSGELAVHLSAGVGYVLLGAVIVLTLLALLSAIPGTLGSVQDIPAAVLALVAASIAATLPAARPETFLTIVVAIGLTSVLAGVFFLLLGAFRLGALVRFVPFPVVGGFLAGTGWLLVVGGTEIVVGVPVSLASIGALLEPATLLRLGPAVLLAVVLLTVARRSDRPLAIPAILGGAFIVFHVGLGLSGMSIDDAATTGWLLGSFSSGSLLQPFGVMAVAGVDWAVILGQTASVGTLVIFAVLALLLNASGIELTLQRDGDLDRELRAAGVANVAAGLAGGMPGYHALSLTALAHKMWARTRLVGLVAAAVCLGMLLIGGGLLTLFPTMLVGGVLMFVGLAFLAEWLHDSRKRMPFSDYLVVLVIVVAMATIGFLQGVAVGLAMAVVFFVVNYSRDDVVKHELSGAALRSKRDRPPSQRELLRTLGVQVEIMELQGYLFFGTANDLLERVRDRVRDRAHARLRYLILDLRRVRDLDTSAVMSFAKIQQLAEVDGFRVIYTGLRERTRRRLTRGPLGHGSDALALSDLDRGLEWCEDQLLGETSQDGDDEPFELRTVLSAEPWDASRVEEYLERIELGAGEVLIEQGTCSADVYLLETGQLTVELAGEGRDAVRLRTLMPGAVVGEASFYVGTPRTASVIADLDSVVLRLSAHAMAEMERLEPELALHLHRWFAGLLAARLGDTLETVNALLD
jgi:sulfate permease, SulP family